MNAESNTLYGNASTDWNGIGTNFNSQAYTDKGYKDLSAGPYGGTPLAIASTGSTTLEMENYDCGGQGVAYHDSTADNRGATKKSGSGIPALFKRKAA